MGTEAPDMLEDNEYPNVRTSAGTRAGGNMGTTYKDTTETHSIMCSGNDCKGCGQSLEEPTEVCKSGSEAGCVAKLGLTEEESKEYDNLSTMHIGQITQDDWNRFHDLNTKWLNAILEECNKREAI